MMHFHFKLPAHDDLVAVVVVTVVLVVLVFTMLGMFFLPYTQFPVMDPYKILPNVSSPM